MDRGSTCSNQRLCDRLVGGFGELLEADLGQGDELAAGILVEIGLHRFDVVELAHRFPEGELDLTLAQRSIVCGGVTKPYATGITGSPMYLVLGLSPGQQALVAPATQRVDYVRVWQRA